MRFCWARWAFNISRIWRRVKCVTGSAGRISPPPSTGIALVPILRSNTRALAWLVVALITLSGLIGAYQAGLQWGFLPGPQGCTVVHPYVMGSGARAPQVSCNVVTWSLFGLSLAGYNAIFSFLIAGTGAFLLSRKHAA